MHRKHDLNNERQNKEILSQRNILNNYIDIIWGGGKLSQRDLYS
jgi:hypothetical protein